MRNPDIEIWAIFLIDRGTWTFRFPLMLRINYWNRESTSIVLILFLLAWWQLFKYLSSLGSTSFKQWITVGFIDIDLASYYYITQSFHLRRFAVIWSQIYRNHSNVKIACTVKRHKFGVNEWVTQMICVFPVKPLQRNHTAENKYRMCWVFLSVYFARWIRSKIPVSSVFNMVFSIFKLSLVKAEILISYMDLFQYQLKGNTVWQDYNIEVNNYKKGM